MWVRYLAFVLVVLVAAIIVLGALKAQERLATRPRDDVAKRHEAALRRARAGLRRAEREHEHRVRRAVKAVTKAGREPTVVSVAAATLRPLTLTLNGTDHHLTPTTTFAVEVIGAVESVVKGAQVTEVDHREVYLTVTDQAWADVVKLRGTELEGARRFAVAGAAAVRNLDQARLDREGRVAAAEQELGRVRADIGELEAARLTLEDLQGAPPHRLDPPPPADGIGPPDGPTDS